MGLKPHRITTESLQGALQPCIDIGLMSRFAQRMRSL